MRKLIIMSVLAGVAVVGTALLMGACGGSGGGTTVPSAPTGVVVTGVSNGNTITWTAVSNADSYNVYYSATETGEYTILTNCTAITTTSCTHDGYANGITYYYKVTASNTAGEGAASDPLSGTSIFEGFLDTSFGTNGYASKTGTFTYGNLYNAASDSSGNIYVTGNNNSNNSFIWKVKSDGTTDTTFGTDGLVTVSDADYWDVFVHTTSDVYIAAENNEVPRVPIVRIYDGTTGALKDTIEFSNPFAGYNAGVHDVKVDSENNVYGIGQTSTDTSDEEDLCFWKYDSSGNPVAGFGNNGLFTVSSVGLSEQGYAFSFNTDGTIVLGGRSGTSIEFHPHLWKITSNGELDESFGTNGVVSEDTVDGGVYYISLSSDENIYVATAGSNAFEGKAHVIAYDANGSKLSGFATASGGIYEFTPTASTVVGLVIPYPERIINALIANLLTDPLSTMLSLNASTGAVDTTFGEFTDGVYTFDITQATDLVLALTTDNLGRVIAVTANGLSGGSFTSARVYRFK